MFASSRFRQLCPHLRGQVFDKRETTCKPLHMQGTGELLRTKEAADLLDEGVRKFIRRVERGEITPAMKLDGIRGAYLFNRSDVEALLSGERAS